MSEALLEVLLTSVLGQKFALNIMICSKNNWPQVLQLENHETDNRKPFIDLLIKLHLFHFYPNIFVTLSSLWEDNVTCLGLRELHIVVVREFC